MLTELVPLGAQERPSREEWPPSRGQHPRRLRPWQRQCAPLCAPTCRPQPPRAPAWPGQCPGSTRISPRRQQRPPRPSGQRLPWPPVALPAASTQARSPAPPSLRLASLRLSLACPPLGPGSPPSGRPRAPQHPAPSGSGPLCGVSQPSPRPRQNEEWGVSGCPQTTLELGTPSSPREGMPTAPPPPEDPVSPTQQDLYL